MDKIKFQPRPVFQEIILCKKQKSQIEEIAIQHQQPKGENHLNKKTTSTLNISEKLCRNAPKRYTSPSANILKACRCQLSNGLHWQDIFKTSSLQINSYSPREVSYWIEAEMMGQGWRAKKGSDIISQIEIFLDNLHPQASMNDFLVHLKMGWRTGQNLTNLKKMIKKWNNRAGYYVYKKKSQKGDTLGPVELIVWPEQGNQGEWCEQDDQGEIYHHIWNE